MNESPNTSHPLTLKEMSLTKLVAEKTKGVKKERTKLCRCVTTDKVGSSVTTVSYQMMALPKCIGGILGSLTVQLQRNSLKIVSSIRSALIWLLRPSSSSCIWIKGRTGARLTHDPGSLRVPSVACRYAQNTVDQCLLNHFPNRENDNYKKWRLCTLCKCCAMTLEPNGLSY